MSKQVSQSRHKATRPSGRCSVPIITPPTMTFTPFGRHRPTVGYSPARRPCNFAGEVMWSRYMLPRFSFDQRAGQAKSSARIANVQVVAMRATAAARPILRRFIPTSEIGCSSIASRPSTETLIPVSL